MPKQTKKQKRQKKVTLKRKNCLDLERRQRVTARQRIKQVNFRINIALEGAVERASQVLDITDLAARNYIIEMLNNHLLLETNSQPVVQSTTVHNYSNKSPVLENAGFDKASWKPSK